MINTIRKASSAGIVCAAGLALIVGMLLAPTPPAAVNAQGSTPTVTPTRTTKLRALLKGSTNKSTDPNGNLAAEVRLPGDNALWAGKAFELEMKQNANLKFRFRVSRLNPDLDNLDQVYEHTENNAPFCPFGDDNGRCQPLPERNGVPWWPDSDVGPAQPVQPGKYVLEVRSRPKSDDENGNWQRDLGSNNAIFFTIDLQPSDVAPPVELPPLSGKAAIVAPQQGSVFRGTVNIRGTATSSDFKLYKFELLDSRCQNGVCFLAEFKKPVANGVLWRWETNERLPNGSRLQNGTYVMQLVVVDKYGRALPNPPQMEFTIQN